MKKIIGIIMIAVISFSMFVIPVNTEAKTLKDLDNELNTLIKKRNAANSKRNKTQQQINNTKSRITQAGKDIEKCEKDIETTEQEIEELGEKIEKKKQEIKEIMQFYQIASNESFYLNYVFGAQDYTDFIYRYAVVEQITAYNQELVDEMKNLVTSNEKKVEDLNNKQKELDALTVKLQETAEDLQDDMKALVDESLSVDQEIKALQQLINFYKKQGCKENEDINKCVTIPFSSEFKRPLKSGRVGSEFGKRYHPTQHVYKLHTGIDLQTGEGKPVLASAAGRVAAIIKKASCGGNQVYLHHNINGVYYTTVYMHLLSYNVKVGDVVRQGEQIGKVGGGSTRSYDRCTTGPHLHFSVATGLYFGSAPYGYSSYSTFVKKLLNPRTILYFPAKGKYF